MTKLKRILIMAGGTGGHVFPGLAIAQYFKDKKVAVDWLGTRKGIEARVVPEAQIPLHFIAINGIRGKGWKALFLAPWRLLFAVIDALKLIRQLKPDVVIGMGGFVSGPGGIASVLLRKKLIIHEQNAKPGTTNKYLAILASKVLTGFPDTFSASPKVIMIGNPVRQEIANIPSPDDRILRSAHPVHLLVVGGSLGAETINSLLPEVVAKIPFSKRPDIWHQTGEKGLEATTLLYEKLNIKAKVVPFINEMGTAYAWADMVLCRAGALTVAELCAAGLGAILIPYPHAVDDHQTANANFLVKQAAACIVQQKELTVDVLVELINNFCSSHEKRLSMAKAAYALRQVDATKKVFTICQEMCR